MIRRIFNHLWAWRWRCRVDPEMHRWYVRNGPGTRMPFPWNDWYWFRLSTKNPCRVCNHVDCINARPKNIITLNPTGKSHG